MDIFSRDGKTRPGQQWEFDATEREFLKAMAGLLPAVLPEEEAKFFDKVIDDADIDLYDMLYPGRLALICQALRRPLGDYVQDVKDFIMEESISDPDMKIRAKIINKGNKLKW